jgi:NDP-sugar pyrophosphorylase family protein
MKLNSTPPMSIQSFFNTQPRVCALILAATKGSRLFPMTSSETPKHLLPVAGVPSILRLLESLASFPQIVIAIASEDDSQTLSVVQKVATLRERGPEEEGHIWRLDMNDTNKMQSITIVKLVEECFGPVDALRQVEKTAVIHESTRVVVFPGDLVVLKKDLDLDPLLRPSPESACTTLLVDVGEKDEHGVPLKESAKVRYLPFFFGSFEAKSS